MRRSRTWLLIADGSRARLVRQLHPDRQTKGRIEDLVFVHEQKPLKDIMSDRPGRSFSSTDSRRSAMEYAADPVGESRKRFARQLAVELLSQLEADAFDRIVVAADPRMLGLIRENLDPKVRERVADEIAKDLVKLPHERLIEVIRAATPVVF